MKINKNDKVRLLRACTQVKIIELTELNSRTKTNQQYLLDRNPALRQYLVGIYNEQQQDNGKPYDDSPTNEDLLNIAGETLDKFEPDEDIAANYRTFAYRQSLTEQRTAALEEYASFADLLYGTQKHPVNLEEINSFLDTKETEHTPSFEKFAKGIKMHPAILISKNYEQLAQSIAKRNKLFDEEYTTKSGRIFDIKHTNLHLNHDKERRFVNLRNKIIIGGAIAASLIAGSLFIKAMNDSALTTSAIGDKTDHTSGQIIETEAPSSEIAIAEDEEKSTIFRNSVTNLKTYQDAYHNYFETISDMYKYNTGEDIDLSGYGGKQFGYDNSCRLLEVEYNGQTFIFSGKSHSPSNYKYLKEVLGSTGAKVTETSSAISYIVDKNDDSRSIAIADSAGNNVRSGKILVGSNDQYNPTYLKIGRQVLSEQGIKNATDQQAMFAYLTSEHHENDYPELAPVLGDTKYLAYFMDSSFIGDTSPYTLWLYENKRNQLVDDFESKAIPQNTMEVQTQAPTQKGDREIGE